MKDKQLQHKASNVNCRITVLLCFRESYEQVVVSQDSFAPVAYLKLTKLLLKEKKPLVQVVSK